MLINCDTTVTTATGIPSGKTLGLLASDPQGKNYAITNDQFLFYNNPDSNDFHGPEGVIDPTIYNVFVVDDNNIWMGGKDGKVYKGDKSGLNLHPITNSEGSPISAMISDGTYIYFGDATGVIHGQ